MGGLKVSDTGRLTLEEIGSRARTVSRILNNLGSREKNIGLEEAARALLENEDEILAANGEDYERAQANGMSQGLLDRLQLTPARIHAMADGLLNVASLDDPVGEVVSMKLRPNGLQIGQKRVPLGVIGMIYEARPNVTGRSAVEILPEWPYRKEELYDNRRKAWKKPPQKEE